MVLPRTTPEQRAQFYEDVESLITVGFLTHPVEVNGLSLHLRSFNPGDLFLLRTRVGAGADFKWQCWAVATSIWMVDGYVILGDPQASASIYHRIRKMPKSAIEILFNIVMSLHARQTRAFQATESYCFEAVSRFKWRAYHTGPINSHSGIPGAERLGLNHAQQMWAAFNEVEDIRRTEEANWEGLKLVASAQAPKGVKSLDDSDKKRRENEENRRQQIMDKFFYTVTGVFVEGAVPIDGPQYILKAKSVEDLEKEMHDWVAGKDDWHDKVVREYKEQIMAKYNQEREDAISRAEALRKAQEEECGESAPLVGYSPSQWAEMVKGHGPGTPGGTRMVYDDPKRDFVYQKYVVREPDSGSLRAVDGKIVVARPEGTAPMAAGHFGEPVPSDSPEMPEWE